MYLSVGTTKWTSLYNYFYDFAIFISQSEGISFAPMYKLSFLIFSFLYFISSASAQQEDTLREISVEQNRLFVKVTETGRNITIIDKKTIKSLPVKSVAELLSWVSGLDVRQRGPWGSQADIGIQGGTFDQSLILIDGVRLSDPQTGHNQMQIPVPLEMIDHIEILKGPAARVYGINALTGAINIVTVKQLASPVVARLYSGSSMQQDTSNGKSYLSYGGGIASGFTKGKVNQIFTAGWDQGNGYRYNTGFTNSRYLSKTSIAFNPNQQLLLLAGYAYNSFGANAFYAAPNDKESHETVQTTNLALKYTHQIGAWRFIPAISYRYGYDNYIYKRQVPDLYHNRHYTNVYNAEFNASRKVGFGQIGFGTEYRKDNIRSNNLGSHQREIIAGAVDVMVSSLKRTTITAGVYVMHHSWYGTRIFPGLEFNYKPLKSLAIFANSGSAQRVPTYTDLYYKGPSNIANPGLKPENSISAEAGVRSNAAWYRVQASVFVRDIANLIDWVKDSATAPWSPVNYNTSRITGIDVNGMIQPFPTTAGRFLSSIKLNAGYCNLNPTFLTSNPHALSKNAVDILQTQLLLQVSANPFPGFSISAGIRNQTRTNQKNYTILDCRIRYQAGKAGVFADFTNLTNEAYQEITAVPMTPRWIAFGITFAP